jgi:hypothetical protein
MRGARRAWCSPRITEAPLSKLSKSPISRPSAKPNVAQQNRPGAKSQASTKVDAKSSPLDKAPAKASKQEALLGLLRRPDGATINQLTKATGWQAHSVRGVMSGVLKKKMGLTIKSEKAKDGERTYRVA